MMTMKRWVIGCAGVDQCTIQARVVAAPAKNYAHNAPFH